MKALTEFDRQWCELAINLLDRPPSRNVRTDSRVRRTDGVSLHMKGLPLLTLRDINLKWPIAEAVWFLSGSSNVELMEKFGFKAWTKFAEDLPGGKHVMSATGWRWRNAYEFDQLQHVLDLLERDPSTRQAVMQSWSPTDDGDVIEAPPNVPCLVTWHFTIMHDKLNLCVLQRSADVWFGLPHDVAGAGIIVGLIARHLEVEPGELHWLIGDAHLYEDQWKAARIAINRAVFGGGASPNRTFRLPRDLLPAAMKGDESVVHAIYNQLEAWYSARAQPAIKGPRLKL